MKRKFVVVTTIHRGVFAGELVEESKDFAILTNARCAIKWATKGGFFELAQKGPNTDSQIGDMVDEVKLYDITSVIKCTEEAEKAWKSA